MKKYLKYVLYALGVVALAVACFFIWKKFNNTETKLTDAEKFASVYTKVTEDNVFVYASSTKVVKILESGSGVVFLGFDECPACQEYVQYINKVAKENDIEKIYYYNIKEDRKNNTEVYKKIVSILEEHLLLDDDENPRIFVPNLTVVKNGKILYNNLETSVLTESDGTAQDYWTEERIEKFETTLTKHFKTLKESTCTSC